MGNFLKETYFTSAGSVCVNGTGNCSTTDNEATATSTAAPSTSCQEMNKTVNDACANHDCTGMYWKYALLLYHLFSRL